MSTTDNIIAYFEERDIKRNEVIAVFVHGADKCRWRLLAVFDLSPEVLGQPLMWVKWGVTKLSGIGTLIPGT